MKKIITLSKGMFDTITPNGKLNSELRSLLKIPDTMPLGIGDTMVMLNSPCDKRDVFKPVNGNREIRYYVVIEPVDERMAYCYSIYEKK